MREYCFFWLGGLEEEARTMSKAMAGAFALKIFVLSIIVLFNTRMSGCNVISSFSTAVDPKPTPWPEQFHSVLVMNKSGVLEVIDLWYDWPNGRNFNIIQKQLGSLLYDLEWNNGTSFYYTLGDSGSCRPMHFEVGILRPNWLDGATYVGKRSIDNFVCNVWEKADFITYYEDVATRRPVGWRFYTGREAHVMTFDVGAVLDDPKWQAPVYCFDSKKNYSFSNAAVETSLDAIASIEGVMRGAQDQITSQSK